MFKPIHNQWPYLLFRAVGLSLAIGIGLYPFVQGTMEPAQAAIFALAVLGAYALLYFLVRPAYAVIEYAQGKLFVSTQKEERANEFYLEIPVSELVKYDLKSKSFGLGLELTVYRDAGEHWLKSKPVLMSPVAPGTRKKLAKQLEALTNREN